MLPLLKKHFGYEQFRPLQEEIVAQCMAGRDALVLMPTGGGKSLCYQLPALALPGITIVVSPLIALMKDQVDALRANGIAAAFVNSSLTASAVAEIESRALAGELKLLYLAPERVAMPHVQIFLKKLNVSLIAIDEAHCISEWGHDFRPEYRSLKILRQLFPHAPIMALTATANVRVRNDILAQLNISADAVFKSSFNRPNLTYRVMPKKRAFDRLLAEVCARPNQAVIVYCFSRKGTEKTVADLRANGINAAAYHAGLATSERTRVQEDFIRDKVSIVVATIAFGMGIDKPDVRLVVHMDLPKSVEGYYQETGRAGRDGLPSDCLLFYSAGDRIKHEFFIREIMDPEEKARARRQVAMIAAYAEGRTCRRAYLLRYFSEEWTRASCGACDICVPVAAPRVQTKTEIEEYDHDLFEKLRTVRRAIADAQGVPPYVVFGDRTLHEMCRVYPHDAQGMARVFGVGKEKLARYGTQFSGVIREYMTAKGIVVRSSSPRMRAESVRRAVSATVLTTIELLSQKKNIEEIARARGMSPSTIFSHLEQAQEQGIPFDLTSVGAPEGDRYELIATAFQNAASDLLTPIRARLGESFSYEEIRLVRLLLRAQSREPSKL